MQILHFEIYMVHLSQGKLLLTISWNMTQKSRNAWVWFLLKNVSIILDFISVYKFPHKLKNYFDQGCIYFDIFRSEKLKVK